jgi:hypothetical protein
MPTATDLSGISSGADSSPSPVSASKLLSAHQQKQHSGPLLWPPGPPMGVGQLPMAANSLFPSSPFCPVFSARNLHQQQQQLSQHQQSPFLAMAAAAAMARTLAAAGTAGKKSSFAFPIIFDDSQLSIFRSPVAVGPTTWRQPLSAGQSQLLWRRIGTSPPPTAEAGQLRRRELTTLLMVCFIYFYKFISPICSKFSLNSYCLFFQIPANNRRLHPPSNVPEQSSHPSPTCRRPKPQPPAAQKPRRRKRKKEWKKQKKTNKRMNKRWSSHWLPGEWATGC